MPTKKITKVVVEEPPPARRVAPYDWPAIAEDVKSKAPEWCKVYQHDKTGYATAMRNGDNTHINELQGFEIRTSNNKPGPPKTCTLFLRYVGPAKKKGA